MSRQPLMIDAGIALIATVLLIVISPGLAVVGLVALLVLIVCGVSVAIERPRRRARRR